MLNNNNSSEQDRVLIFSTQNQGAKYHNSLNSIQQVSAYNLSFKTSYSIKSS